MVEKVAASSPHRAVEATCEGQRAGNSEKMAASTPHRHNEAAWPEVKARCERIRVRGVSGNPHRPRRR